MFDDFVDKVIECRQCPRLVKYIDQVARTKVKRFNKENYWAKPLPGFGDPNAALLIIGLAPAAHGGNRTGRIFTGDSSGDWLAKALYETGFANQETSISRNDGYKLTNSYVTAVVKCAPPNNIPTPIEIQNCSQYLKTEIELLGNHIKVIITLGKIAFDGYCKISGLKGLSFGHNLIYSIGENRKLISSYHPSRRNTNTGTLTWDMWINVFKSAQLLVET